MTHERRERRGDRDPPRRPGWRLALGPDSAALGGEARLQHAICLDSLGRNQEAYEIYKRIQGHPAPGVAKNVKR